MSIIFTEKDKCKGCYACIRFCPVKAIKVEDGLAQVMKDRCIVCGNCLKVCVTNAKRTESDVSLVWQLLGMNKNVIAVMSSSFPAALPAIVPGNLISALKKLGFSEVMEDSFGAELIGKEYARQFNEPSNKTILTSNCPAVVSYIEKYYPKLINNLAHIVSPMVATGRLIKKYFDPDAKIVFIGPCVAKKAEARDEGCIGAIDAVLTFADLKEMFAAKGINPETQGESGFFGPHPDLGRLVSISGGLLKISGLSDDIQKNDIISAHGREYVAKILKEYSMGEIDAKMINLYFCHGCIDGPVIDNDLSVFRRKELIVKYTENMSDPQQTEKDIQEFGNINLSRLFNPQNVSLSSPDDEAIDDILETMNRLRPENQFNCGACGYNSCRELAIAVCQGLAEIEMCWPYLHNHLQETQEELIQAEKLTSLGQLAASVAHEINNPLSGVLVYTQLIAKRLKNDQFSKDTTLDYLNKMETELHRSTKLVRSLLDFSRQSVPKFAEVNINDIVERSYDLGIHSTELQFIKINKEMSSDLPVIIADADQIQQVCTNLIINAIHAMPDGGELTLRTLTDGIYVKIEVIDTGVGIKSENMRKLFTPFFTTKKDNKGVGLGLAISYGIVQRHHGKIDVKSVEGHGAKFTICLPVKYAEDN
ncbi:MAG: [Fe-Fe] hydrogenase large subunit C-terminal domain-containing protein [Dehalococcoidales bacterium]|nr:[Fe-Fe] hydrogenase large subunit C-terminal domain-containing protein [Dehalococcoidales bacterium]